MQEEGDADAWRKPYERKVRWIRAYIGLGWPVALGTYAISEGCSCRRGCSTPARHPISRSTMDAGWLANLLLYHRDANILVAAGPVVTAIEFPAVVDPETLLQVPAPAARIANDTYLFLAAGGVAPGSRLRCYAHGSHIPLPPSQLEPGREMRWLRMPFGRPLFDPRMVLDELKRWG